MLNRQFFEQLLIEMDPAKMAAHSKLNHHVNGMDYLCLHRSEKLTAKLYLIQEPRNQHSGYLVHPHSHRYSFGSVVLHGGLEHIRFERSFRKAIGDWSEHRYDPDTKQLKWMRQVTLDKTIERHEKGSSYWVEPHEIHTLRLAEGKGPVLIGLVQFEDTSRTSDLYLPNGRDFVRSNERVPTPAKTEELRRACMRLIQGAAC